MLNIDISDLDYQKIIDFIDKNILDFNNFELNIFFKSDYNQSKIIRWIIMHFFDKVNVESIWWNRFSLISDELVNNAIEYWSLPLDKNNFLIKFSKIENILYINIEVHDTWRWVSAKTSLQMEEIRKEKESEWFDWYLKKRWRWLFQLIKNIADDIYFKDKEWWWLIVWVNKKIMF